METRPPRFAAGRHAAQCRRGCRPGASAMDFEDGKRRPWLVAAVGKEAGGLRWGSVYRLKMAVWALFCGPGGRPPASRGPSAGIRPPRGPRAPTPPAAPAPTAPWDLGVPGRPGRGRTRPERDGRGARPGCVRTDPAGASQLPGAGPRGEPGLRSPLGLHPRARRPPGPSV